jgi:hypothetical protein
MTANVSYQGISIVKGVPAREDGASVWIECEFPMPVGTRLEVELDHAGPRPARVVRVQEAQQGGGMGLEWTGDTLAQPPADEPAASRAPEGGEGRRGKRRR